MWYKIKEDKHRAYPLSLGIHTGKTNESYEVIFDDSCRYQLDEENQLDWNKLVGWSYGLHHNNSIRIAWRYNKELDKIEITNYGYLDGERIVAQDIIQVLEFNKKYILELDMNDSDFNTSKWGYNLGIYFGGNLSSPKDMKIWLRKLS